MSQMVYGESVRGASHIREEKPCQDSFKCKKIADTVTLLAVADGHGSDSCPYSQTGSVIAVNTFFSVIEGLFENFSGETELFMTYLNREGEVKIAQAIDKEWKRRVWKIHTNNKREKPVRSDGKLDKEAVYRMYGSTLIGLLITSDFLFAFQIGDGDIVRVEDNSVQSVIDADKILGVETHSLSSKNAWEKAITVMRRHEGKETKPVLYMLSTDGFANSYPSTDAFEQTCQSYYEMIQEHGFEAVKENLKDWLNETSEFGCGDDITVVLNYYF